MPRNLPPRVRVKTAKGRTYYYFDTGSKNELNRPILKRLPDIGTAEFGPALVAAQNAAKRRGITREVMRVSTLIELYLKSPEFMGLAESSRNNYTLYLGQIARRIGVAPAAALEPRDVMQIRDSMADRTGAANQWIAALGALYRWGRRRGYVTNEPTKDIARFDKSPHKEWPEHLLQAALEDEAIGFPVALLYYTAQRIGDVCQMRWADIRGGAIHMRQQKTGKALMIPIHSELVPMLERAPRAALTILERDGRPMTPHYLRTKLNAWVSGHGAKLVPHGLRRNAIIALLECGCSLAETAAISGQTLQMVEHYAKGRNQAKLASAAIHRWNKQGNGKTQ